MSTRKYKLVDCNPQWVTNYSGKCGDSPDAIRFDCPEGHADCIHVIPFTPALDGSPAGDDLGRAWRRQGDTFETLVLGPSIKRNPRHANREAAIAAGCLPEYITDTLFCALHIFVGGSGGRSPGAIEFCGDSK